MGKKKAEKWYLRMSKVLSKYFADNDINLIIDDTKRFRYFINDEGVWEMSLETTDRREITYREFSALDAVAKSKSYPQIPYQKEEYLHTLESIAEEKPIKTLSFEVAKEMYDTGGIMKEAALGFYTEKELTKPVYTEDDFLEHEVLNQIEHDIQFKDYDAFSEMMQSLIKIDEAKDILFNYLGDSARENILDEKTNPRY